MVQNLVGATEIALEVSCQSAQRLFQRCRDVLDQLHDVPQIGFFVDLILQFGQYLGEVGQFELVVKISSFALVRGLRTLCL